MIYLDCIAIAQLNITVDLFTPKICTILTAQILQKNRAILIITRA